MSKNFYIDESPNGARYFYESTLVSRELFEEYRETLCIHRWNHHEECRDCGLPKPLSNECQRVLQTACDRAWENETLLTTCIIAANAIVRRNVEIEKLKAERDVLRATIGVTVVEESNDKKTYWPYGW